VGGQGSIEGFVNIGLFVSSKGVEILDSSPVVNETLDADFDAASQAPHVQLHDLDRFFDIRFVHPVRPAIYVVDPSQLARYTDTLAKARAHPSESKSFQRIFPCPPFVTD